jgi:hypothetical protein
MSLVPAVNLTAVPFVLRPVDGRRATRNTSFSRGINARLRPAPGFFFCTLHDPAQSRHTHTGIRPDLFGRGPSGPRDSRFPS